MARHAHPEAPGDWPTKPSGIVEDTSEVSTFPSNLGPEDVKSSIDVTVRNGNVDGAIITYSGSKLNDLGIDEMTVIRGAENGVFVTAYPG